jgi:hypothetical protein
LDTLAVNIMAEEECRTNAYTKSAANTREKAAYMAKGAST